MGFGRHQQPICGGVFDDVQAVAVEGRNHESLAMARRAIEAGKHVWFDKPAGDDWPAFQKLMRSAAERGLHVQMGYMFRYSPGFRAPMGHSHREQEEVYVVVSGAGRIKLNDDIVELRQWDAVRVAPETVRALVLPSGDGRTNEISAQAGPLLQQEAMTAQSAQIDTISGASYTSDGYRRSLQAALDRANA